MNMPFCDQCAVASRCMQDLALFDRETGNKRIPPESFCRARHEEAGVPFDDFYKKVLIREVDNPYALIPVFPELKEELEALEKEEA